METYDAIVTILALDISGHPELPWGRVVEAVSRLGGQPVRREEGRLLVAFGMKEGKDDPRDAVRAFETLLGILEPTAQDPSAVRLRAGIARGVVTITAEDGELREVMGDAVDVAVRLAVVARRGELLVDEETGSAISASYSARPFSQDVRIKGRKAAGQFYAVADLRPRTPVPDLPGLWHRSVEEGSWRGQAAPSEESGTELDRVDCTVFAPPSAVRGDSVLVQVFAHMPAQEAVATALAREMDDQAERRGFRSLAAMVARGTRLTIDLTLRGLEIDGPVQSLVWNGRPEAVQFGVTIPAEAEPSTLIGLVTIAQSAIPIGQIRFKLTINAADRTRRSDAPQPVGDDARHFRKAFISYASHDRAKVLARVQMLGSLGIGYFQDVLDLDPGDRWERKLYAHIDACDLFLLFWSRAARESDWVLKEVRYALARQDGDQSAPPTIRPVIIEGPPLVQPPPELAHLHFNDRLLYFLSDPTT